MHDHTLAAIEQRCNIGTKHVEDWLVKAVHQRCKLLGIACSLLMPIENAIYSSDQARTGAVFRMRYYYHHIMSV